MRLDAQSPLREICLRHMTDFAKVEVATIGYVLDSKEDRF